MSEHNIWKLKMRAYDAGLLDSFVKNLVTVCKGLMVKVKVIFLPVQNKRFALAKSPFVYGATKEHFKISFHNRVVFLELGAGHSLNLLNQKVSVPDGVFISAVKRVTNKASIGNK